ncbi:FGGY family carbohydrate kinase, partial [Micromonospora zhanjiangensis]
MDAGTTVTKAVAFDPAGVPLARVARPTALHRVADGWYEQDADQVVDSVRQVLAELTAAVDR